MAQTGLDRRRRIASALVMDESGTLREVPVGEGQIAAD